MSLPDEFIILSIRVKDTTLRTKGSIEMPCHGCQEPVWVAPSSQDVLHLSPRILCNQCGIKEMREQMAAGDDVQLGVLPGIEDDLNNPTVS